MARQYASITLPASHSESNFGRRMLPKLAVDKNDKSMNVTFTRPDDTVSQADLIWQRRVDALACGEVSEEDFVAELSSLRQSGADSAWSVLGFLCSRWR